MNPYTSSGSVATMTANVSGNDSLNDLGDGPRQPGDPERYPVGAVTRRLLGYVRPHRISFTVSFVSAAISVILQLYTPILIGEGIDLIVAAGQVDFDSEFTLLTVTQKDGPTLFCPPIGHVQKGGDYRESWQPFQIPEEALKKAEHIAGEVTKALTGAGLWGVEFFLSKQGEVIFSELSPRPHDTGMVTLGHTTNLSEFELHFRAVMGLPIAGIHLEHIGCSAVILSPEESTEPLNYNMLDALKEDHTRIRIFGKPEAHVGRRMGVVLCYGEKGDDLNQLRDKAKRLAKTVLGTDPYMKK